MKLVFITIVIFLALIALYIFLIAPRLLNKPDITPFTGYHYAHRGLFNNSDAPENSIKAFELAIKAGYGIELDIQLTKDGIPVVFHDATLQRMCNTDGRICDHTLEQLKTFRIGQSQERIPTFAEALATINGKTPIIIEFKPYDVPSKLCTIAWHILSTYKGVYCIESFHPLVLRWFKKHYPHIYRGQLCMEYWKESGFKGQVMYILLSFLITNFLTRPDFIAYKHDHAGNISRRLCRTMGATAFAWTIKSKEQYNSAQSHYDLFIFDSFEL